MYNPLLVSSSGNVLPVPHVNGYIIWFILGTPKEQVSFHKARAWINRDPLLDLALGAGTCIDASCLLVDIGNQTGIVKGIRALGALDIGLADLLLSQRHDCLSPGLRPHRCRPRGCQTGSTASLLNRLLRFNLGLLGLHGLLGRLDLVKVLGHDPFLLANPVPQIAHGVSCRLVDEVTATLL